MIRGLARALGWFAWVAVTWSIAVYHRGVLPARHPEPPKAVRARWIPRTDPASGGINQLALDGGDDFSRGYAAGSFTAPLLQRQEAALRDRLREFFPRPWMFPRAFQLLELPLIRWFWGIDRYFPEERLAEMEGVSRWTSHEFDVLAEPRTRQLAYHGLHEVGQMMVDQMADDQGCTVFVVPGRGMVGRNFDFEGGRIFDEEKILKWVWPEQGHAYVSVIWAGMVGVVTGVNDAGIYISINAAGSSDYSRYGTPSTLVALDVLERARTVEEARKILNSAQMFITDVFVVGKIGDADSWVRVEKSPGAMDVIPLKDPSVVTNHLISPRWREDRVNRQRRDELTSTARQRRGEEILAEWSRAQEGVVTAPMMAQALRDKNGKPLGHRSAIDSLIATHSVILDGTRLYVNRGPSASGEYVAYDWARSFREREPRLAPIAEIPRDPLVAPALYPQVRAAEPAWARSRKLSARGDCARARAELESVPAGLRAQSDRALEASGDLARCQGDLAAARRDWQAALAAGPAYLAETRRLKKKAQATP